MPTTYTANAVNPYLYAEGVSNKPLTGYVPPTGIPEIPITLNQTFFIEAGGVFVPQIGSSGMQIDAWKTTFVNPGSPAIKKVMILSNGFDATINEAYDFFNVVTESGSDVLTDGVYNIAVAGTVSSGRRLFTAAYKQMLISTRGVYTVVRANFPYTGPNNPSPSRNVNGVQSGSLITFHTQDWFGLYVFELPQDTRTKFNTMPSV
jgi:hypothetical protein